MQNDLTASRSFRISRCYGKVEVIVTDSPVMLGKIYADRIGRPALGMACVEEAERYKANSANVMLTRVKPYNPNGRNQTETEARVIDDDIRTMLREHDMSYIEVTGDKDGYDKVYKMILDAVETTRRKAADTPIREVTPNGIYRHFKGKYYIVLECADNYLYVFNSTIGN